MPFQRRDPHHKRGLARSNFRSATSPGTFPDAVSHAVNAKAAHRAGLTGEGVSVLVIDRPITNATYFTDRAYVVSPMARGRVPSHGSAVAASVLAIAPRVELRAVSIHQARHALRRSKADIVVCAWGMPPDSVLVGLLERNAHRVLSVRACARRVPGALETIRCVDESTVWPRGPFRFPNSNRPFCGLSIAVGVAGGAAALLSNAGMPTSEALDRVVQATCPEPFSLTSEVA